MKQTATTIILLLLFTSCHFSKSIDKDLITGALTKGNGVSYKETSIKVNGKEKKTNKYLNGDEVHFIFNGVSGFKAEKGLTYPEATIEVIKDDTQTILENKNVLNVTDGSELKSFLLTFNFTVGSSEIFNSNSKYKVRIKIWDKKGTGTLTYEMPFSIIDK